MYNGHGRARAVISAARLCSERGAGAKASREASCSITSASRKFAYSPVYLAEPRVCSADSMCDSTSVAWVHRNKGHTLVFLRLGTFYDNHPGTGCELIQRDEL
jgi:hypothetical protein